MRICILVDNLDQSTGWGRLAKNLGDALVRRGHEVRYIARRGEVAGAETLHVPMRNLSLIHLGAFILGGWSIRRYASRCDVLICFDLNPYGIISAASLLGCKTRFMLYCLGSYSLPTKSAVRNLLMRFAVRQAGVVLIVGEFLRTEMNKKGLDLSEARALPVGVDIDFFHKVSEQPIIKGRYIVGVGGIKYRKGFHLSLAAFGRVARSYSDLAYCIVGRTDKDAYFSRLVEQARQLGVSNKVIFIHNASDEVLRNIYSYAECFVLTPVTTNNALEGFGMVYLEAALCGLPAVGTKGSGAVEAIADGVTGLLAESTPEKIAESIERILSDTSYRDMLSRNALHRAIGYGWDAIASKLEVIINTVA